MTSKYAMLTPYQYGSNNPVWNIDIDGLEGASFQDVMDAKASVFDWINNANTWKAGLDNISSINPFWRGYVRSHEVVTGKDYNTGEAKSRVSSAIEGAGEVMFALTLGKFLKIPNASAPLEMQMAQNAKAAGQPLATPAQEAVKTVEEKSMAKLSTPVQQTAKAVTRSLDDLNSLRGATWKEAESLIPKDWTRGPLNKGEGIKFVNPAKKGEQILLEKGWPGAKDPLHAGPYMRISRDGQITRIPLEGNPTLK